MQVKIGDRLVGDGQPCYVIAELGINHNGSVDIAKRLIDAAYTSGADAVKLQKRTVEQCYTKAELDTPRQSPWGSTTRQQKMGLELSATAYKQLDFFCQMLPADHAYCRGAIKPLKLGTVFPWFASCWDIPSVDLIDSFNPPCYKIASACLTDRNLLSFHCCKGKPILLSTGMSTLEEIDAAVSLIQKLGNPLILMHCTSTYPSKPEELNLSCIPALKKRYRVPVGYSGHEVGLQTTVAAVMLGACVVERHLTLDRSMYGSDQSASVEPHGFAQMVRDIRACEQALGDGIKRVYDSELPIKAKLRKVETLL